MKFISKKHLKTIFAIIISAIAIYYERTQNTLITQGDAKETILTKHAKCRMNCRNIRKDEIVEILTSGYQNYRKSNMQSKPCPTIAYEGYSSDRQKIRVISAECPSKRKIVTVIDLDKEYQCDCK